MTTHVAAGHNRVVFHRLLDGHLSGAARRRALAAALAAGVAACGVGVGAGKDQTVGLLVTRDFGRVAVGGGERTVKGAVQRHG